MACVDINKINQREGMNDMERKANERNHKGKLAKVQHLELTPFLPSCLLDFLTR